LQPASRQANSSSGSSSSSSSSKPAKSISSDKCLQEQQQLKRQQQQHRQPWQQVLPCSSSHAESHRQPDQQCYQGPAGGVVALPKQGTALWQATFYGNVPTHWWQQQNKDSAAADDPATTISSGSSSSSSGSSSSSSSGITTWEQLVQQSPFINSSFRLARPGTPRVYTKNGIVDFGQQKLSRDNWPCPKPMLRRDVRVRLQQQLEPILSVTDIAARCTYAYNRRRLLRSVQRRQQRQAAQQLQQQQRQQRGRFALRSRGYLAAAADALAANKAGNRPPWRPSTVAVAAAAAATDAANAAEDGVDAEDYEPAGVGHIDCMVRPAILPPITPDSIPSTASDVAAASGVAFGAASRCVARRDQRGKLLPLPDDCTATGSRCVSCSEKCYAADDAAAEQQQGADYNAELPASPSSPSSSSSSSGEGVIVSAGRIRKGLQPGARKQQVQQQAQQPPPAAADPTVSVSKPLRPAGDPLSDLRRPVFDAALFAPPGSAVASLEVLQDDDDDSDYDSDDDEYTDDEDDSEYDSDDEYAAHSRPYGHDAEDDDDSYQPNHGLYEWKLEIDQDALQVVQQPHAYRTASSVVYGFWTKCPLG
jgi:hypothetical protein